MADLIVAPCDHKAAKYAVEHWHYSRSMPKSKLVKFGVWEDGIFIGAVIFGSGANNGMLAAYGLTQTEGCELVRVALRQHSAPVTQLVAQSLILLKSLDPGLRLVVSFADPEQGHVGGIYKAGNWIYTGKSQASEEYMVAGKRWHGCALRQHRANHPRGRVQASNTLNWARRICDPNASVVMGTSKHRYLYPLDRAMRRQIQKLAQPYPRAAEVSTGHA